MTEITLKLPDEIYQQIKNGADRQQIPPAEYAVKLLQEILKDQTDDTFELRQFQAKKIPGRKFNLEHELVLVDGINYRYQLVGEMAVNPAADYMVVGAKGNVLTIKKWKTSQTS